MHSAEPRTTIANTCCPVCGTGISARARTVELRPSNRHGLLVTIRVDGRACAAAVAREPDKFVHAAEINQVAH